jgi:predicted lipoprotein with Yx(FWY)xxD motif
MRIRGFIELLVGVVVIVAACTASGGALPASSTPPVTEPSPAAEPSAQPSPADAAGTVVVKAGQSDLGEILVDPDGLTLYGFTNDVDAIPTCYDACATAWPPVIVDADWQAGPGLDSGVFSTIERNDGSFQLVAGKFPLYLYAGDAAPGDATGQGSGDVWFVVATDAKLIQEAPGPGASAPATKPVVALARTELGQVLVDSQGRTLYGFTDDAAGVPTCYNACANAWPPAVVDGDITVGQGLAADGFSIVDREGGARQLKAGKWPLYTFSGDGGPGDINGQSSGGVWFAVGADGKLIK